MDPALLAHVVPGILSQRETLAEEDNAVGPWTEALKALTPMAAVETSCDTAYCCSELTIPSLILPASAAGLAYRENVAANRRSLELIDIGIDRGRFQFSELPGLDDFNAGMATVQGLRELIRLRERYVCVLATDGNLAAAGRALLRSLTMTDMVIRGDGCLVHFLVAIALKGHVLAAIRAFAFTAAAPAESMTELLAAIDRESDLDARLAQAGRRDFQSWTMPGLTRLAAADPLDKFVASLMENYYALGPMEVGDETPAPRELDDRNAWRHERIMYLLEGHPAPFDKAETLRMASEAVVAAVRDLEAKPTESQLLAVTPGQSAKSLLEDGAWPEHLAPGLPYEYIGNSRDARRRRKGLKAAISPEMLASIEPPSEAAMALARQKLRQVSNPVGRMLVARGACSPTFMTRRAQGRLPADEVATKVSLAIRLNFDRFGGAPMMLTELVAAGLLRDAPIDPFDGLPLRYSRERGLLWSVGLDGKDGNGDPLEDIVWPAPVAGGS